LFRPYFTRNPQAKQKAINLNADVFIDIFYPTLRSSHEARYRVDLRIFGPGLAGEYPLQRKVIKEQKNWRLDGELVENPPEEPGRFDLIMPDDLAIVVFDGVIPDIISLYLISSSNAFDEALHAVLKNEVADERKSMKSIDLEFLRRVVQQVQLDESHPLRNLLSENVLEDAAQNGISGIDKLQRRASTRRITQEVLQQARENAAYTGKAGEEIVNTYFSQMEVRHEIESFEWVSELNAISPFDFVIKRNDKEVFVDVKATTGSFDNPLHISYNELLKMREADYYELYRIYELSESSAWLRIARNLKQFADQLLPAFEQLQEGVSVDSISVRPTILNFENAIHISGQVHED
jgi:hypothetical protein